MGRVPVIAFTSVDFPVPLAPRMDTKNPADNERDGIEQSLLSFAHHRDVPHLMTHLVRRRR